MSNFKYVDSVNYETQINILIYIDNNLMHGEILN